MNKKILPILTVISFAVSAQGQNFNDQKLWMNPSEEAHSLSIEHNRPDDAAESTWQRAAGDTIWYDNFADLSQWTVGGTGAFGTADSVWEHTTDGPYGTFSGSWGNLQSTTAANGWAMFDSDGNGSADPNTGGPTGIEFDTYLQMTNAVDLTNFPFVAITFQEFYKELNSEVFLDVSTDGSTWTTMQLHAGFAVNDQTEQDAVLYQDISFLAGGQPAVWVRLRFEGYGYFWQIDDFAIVEGIENDIKIEKVYTGNNESDYLYTKVPMSQAVNMDLGVVATNAGGAEQTNVSVDWEISDATFSVVASGTELISASITAGSSDTIFFQSNYTPTATGVYSINMIVSSDETDSDTLNNVGSETIEITDYLWAHDYDNENYLEFGYEATSTNGENGFEMGARYACKVNGDFIYALVFPLGTSTNAPSIFVRVYENATTSPAVSETLYDIQSGDLSSVNNVKYITVVLEDPVEMIIGNTYTATVVFEAGDDGFILGNQIDDNDNGQAVYFGPPQDTWFNWVGLTTGMRLDLNPNISGVAENVEKISFGIFPNPTANELNIRFSDSQEIERITIINITGKRVMEIPTHKFQNANKAVVDVSELISGVYFIRVTGSDRVSSQKLIIE